MKATSPDESVRAYVLPPWSRLGIILGLCAGTGLLGAWYGQTASWDLRNYHLYNPWAWLNGRGEIDLAAAQLQTFFNPVLYVPVLLLTEHVHPWLATFVLGAVQGLNVVPLYLISARIMPESWTAGRPWWPAAVAGVGATGATQLGELGATQCDNVVTLPFLAGVAMLVGSATDRHPRGATLSIAGLLLGAATGLKPSVAPLTAGVIVSAPLLACTARQRLRAGTLVVAGGAAGMTIAGGFWMFELWQRYGNPLYPMFSSLFDNAQSVPFSTRDARWLPGTIADATLRPFVWLVNWGVTSEVPFRDLRIPLLYGVAVALPIAGLRRLAQLDRRVQFLFASFVIGYAAWLLLFGYYRYLVAWEMLAPGLVIAALVPRTGGVRRRHIALMILLAVLVLSTRGSEWGRTLYGGRFLDVSVPARAGYDRALIALAGDTPLAYVALRWPGRAPFIRLSGNFYGDPYPPHGWDTEAARRLDAHDGPIVVLSQTENIRSLDPALTRFGLTLDPGLCDVVFSNLASRGEPPVRLCAASRSTTARAALELVRARWRTECATLVADPHWTRICARLRDGRSAAGAGSRSRASMSPEHGSASPLSQRPAA